MNCATLSYDRSLKPISGAVIFTHLLLIAWLFAFSPEVSPKTAPKRLTVSTVKLTPKPIVKTPEQSIAQKQPVPKQSKPDVEKSPQVAQEAKKAVKPSEKKTLAKPAPSPPPKKTAPKKPSPPPKKTQPTKQPPPPPKTDPMKEKQLALLSQAKEKIDRVNANSDKVVAKAALPASLPSKIESLSIESLKIEATPSMGVHEIAYRDELSQRLKLMLKLPEYGTVKIKLTLNRLGKVVKIQVVSAESQSNRSHIEKCLPKITFPPFGTQFEGAEEFTFNITMSNDV